jgi:hypothetical protein
MPENEILYIFILCPFCGMKIWGTWKDIDSGLRHHLDYEYCDSPMDSDDL